MNSISTAKRRFKAPFLVLLLALSLLLPGVLPPPVAFAAGGLKLDLFLGTYDGLKAYASGDLNPTQKLDYWSGESVPAVAQIAASGDDSATGQDVALTLTVPKVARRGGQATDFDPGVRGFRACCAGRGRHGPLGNGGCVDPDVHVPEHEGRSVQPVALQFLLP